MIRGMLSLRWLYQGGTFKGVHPTILWEVPVIIQITLLKHGFDSNQVASKSRSLNLKFESTSLSLNLYTKNRKPLTLNRCRACTLCDVRV